MKLSYRLIVPDRVIKAAKIDHLRQSDVTFKRVKSNVKCISSQQGALLGQEKVRDSRREDLDSR